MGPAPRHGPESASASDTLASSLLRPTRHHPVPGLPDGERIERLGRIGSWDLGDRGRPAAWSRGTCRLFRLPTGTPPSLDAMAGALIADDAALLRRTVAAALDSGSGLDLTVRLRGRNGSAAARLRLTAESGIATGRDRHLCGIVRDVSEECAREDRLRHLVEHDPLTGLDDPRALRAAIAAWPASPDAARMLLVRLELDRFAAVNDHHGRDAGDAVLQETATRLRDAAPDAVSIARLGGGEFALLLPEFNDLGRRLRRIRRRCSLPVRLGAARLVPGVSVGAVVQDVPAPGAGWPDPDTLLHDAGLALRQAAERGRRRARVFRPGMRAALDAERMLLAQADAALERDEFTLHFQPIIDLRTRAVRGMEALLRWHHPARGLLAPGAFAPVLRDPDLSARIGGFVLARSLFQLRNWDEAGLAVPFVNVNVARSQLECGQELLAAVDQALRNSVLAPERLGIEIVENAFLGHRPDEIGRTVAALRRRGVLTALDDFGTGYASLTHLKALAVGRIKIDRSFVADLGQPDSRAITRAIIDLGASLGTPVVAEGIETPEQLAILLAAGCDCGQGYLFSRPLPPERIPDFLRGWEGTAAALFDRALIPPLR